MGTQHSVQMMFYWVVHLKSELPKMSIKKIKKYNNKKQIKKEDMKQNCFC